MNFAKKIAFTSSAALLAVVCFALLTVFAAGEKDVKKMKPAGSQEKKTAVEHSTSSDNKGTVAMVNGVAITRAQFDNELARYQRQVAMGGRQAGKGDAEDVKAQVMEGLIDRELLKQEAVKDGFRSSDAEVEQQVGALKKRFPDEKEFTRTLQSMNLTEAKLKEQMQQDLAIRKMIDHKIASKVTVKPEEARAFYDTHPDLFQIQESVRASHILIKVDPGASAAEKAKARERIVNVQQRIKKGEDFGAVAKEVSECPSGANGGDLDYFQRGQMVGPFEEVVFSLQPGAVSEVVETQFGYHLIKLTDKRGATTVSFDDVKGKIEAHLKQQQVEVLLGEHVKQLRSGAKIETFVN